MKMNTPVHKSASPKKGSTYVSPAAASSAMSRVASGTWAASQVASYLATYACALLGRNAMHLGRTTPRLSSGASYKRATDRPALLLVRSPLSEGNFAARAVMMEQIRLGPMDHAIPRIYTRIVFYYERLPSEDCLRHSLHSLTKQEYLPWAGRLSEDADGRLSLNFTKKSEAQFLDRSAPEQVTYAAVRGDLAEFSTHNTCFFAPQSRVARTEELPFHIWVTRFRDLTAGAVCIMLNHSVADGAAVFDFMRKWSAEARGVRYEGKKVHSQFTMKALHDRLFIPLSDTPQKAPPLEFRLLPKSSDVEPALSMPALSPSVSLSESSSPLPVRSISSSASHEREELQLQPSSAPSASIMTHRILRFSSRALVGMKSAAIAPITDPNKFVSTNDVLVSLLWRAVTRSRGHAEGVITRLSLAVDGRQRHARIPPSYAGNATYHACTLLDCGYLSAAPITNVALAVRKSIACLGKDEMEAAARWLNGVDDVRRIQSVASGVDPDFLVTQWVKFAERGFDFGFGEPEAIRVPPSPLDGHAILLPEARQGGGIDVLLRLKNETMIKLIEDEELLSTGIQVFGP